MENYSVILASEVIHTSDKNLGGNTIASVVITGIAVVFIALALLIIFVSLYGKIFESINRKKEQQAAEAKAAEAKKAEAAAKKADAQKAAPAPAPVVQDGIEEETVAVIMAAIAAYGAQSGKQLAVKSIKASQGGSARRNAWSAAGIAEATRPF